MGNKIYRLFEYVYILMAVFSIYLVVTNWENDRNRAYLFVFFAVVAIFMFFFNLSRLLRRFEDVRIRLNASLPKLIKFSDSFLL